VESLDKHLLRSKYILYSVAWFLSLCAFISSYMALIVNLEKFDKESLKANSIAPVEVNRDIKGSEQNIPKVVERKNEFTLSDKVTNIAILGLDERAKEYDGEWARADSMMILTIDEKNKKIKLSSILRDCYVDVLEYGMIVKDKINHSFAYGASEEYSESQNPNRAYHAGGLRSIKVLNDNFDLDIKDYVIINFSSFQNIIDKIGGVTINLTEDEVYEINCAMGESNVYGKYIKVSEGAGLKVLNGKQALAYARDRTNGGDSDRARRQRNVIQSIYKSLKKLNPIQLTAAIKELNGMVKTNLTCIQIVSLSTKVLFNDMSLVNTRFPVDNNWYGDRINEVCYDIIDDEELNIRQMKDFIFKDILPDVAEDEETTTAPQ